MRNTADLRKDVCAVYIGMASTLYCRNESKRNNINNNFLVIQTGMHATWIYLLG